MATTSSFMAFQVSSSLQDQRASILPNTESLKTAFSSLFQPKIPGRGLKRAEDCISAKTIIQKTTTKMLDAFVDSVFEFVDQPLLPSQSNFAPVDELGRPALIKTIDGDIPDDFPSGVYIRNGANPLFGALKSTKSIFGKSNYLWIEGEGMVHALYFSKDTDQKWTTHYNNRYVETETFKHEKLRNKPSFLPLIKGDLLALVSASLLNLVRFGTIDKHVSNTNVFEHSGKLYTIAECHLPHEIDLSTLKTLGPWTLSLPWNRPFTSHPKRAPGSGELVIFGVDPVKRPYMEMGVISADGKRLVHRVDLKLDRCTFCHDFGVTQRYNVFMDFPVTIDVLRLFTGGSLIEYNKDGYARIGVMPRFGDADSIKWFEVKSNCTFHFINCFEDKNDEVVVRGCRALGSTLPFDKSGCDGSLVHVIPYEWRLNMRTGEVIKETSLAAESETELSMDVPFMNEAFNGLRNRFGYAQVFKSIANSSADDIPKFVGLAKLDFEENDDKGESNSGRPSHFDSLGSVEVEYHMFEEGTYCSEATFVSKQGGFEEDDGWIVTFVHNEHTNTSQAVILDAKKFTGEPVTKITLPRRVPYGFHGAFIKNLKLNSTDMV